MKATFELKTWMTKNRETVINEYNKLTNEKFYNGITLKDFMIQIFNSMLRNNVKSEKRAESMLPFLIGQIYFDNSKVTGEDKLTDSLREKYDGTSYMALV